MPDYSEDYDEDNLRLDPLEEGMDPPEHWSEADKFGMTESEARQGQDLNHRLREEQPDITPESADRPIGATPDEELDESIDDLTDDTTDDVDTVGFEELAVSGPTWAVRRGQSADEAGGSVADEIRTPPHRPDESS